MNTGCYRVYSQRSINTSISQLSKGTICIFKWKLRTDWSWVTENVTWNLTGAISPETTVESLPLPKSPIPHLKFQIFEKTPKFRCGAKIYQIWLSIYRWRQFSVPTGLLTQIQWIIHVYKIMYFFRRKRGNFWRFWLRPPPPPLLKPCLVNMPFCLRVPVVFLTH